MYKCIIIWIYVHMCVKKPKKKQSKYAKLRNQLPFRTFFPKMDDHTGSE